MKKVAVIVLVIMASVVLVASAFAESATKDECVTKSKDAAQLIKEKGMNAAFQDLQNKDGKFVWKDTYVFVMDFTGTHLTHPLRPEMVGKNVIGFKDSNGKLVVKEFIEVANTTGEGWVEYMYPKPAELKKPEKERILSKKISYVYRVPGTDMFVGAGVWEQVEKPVGVQIPPSVPLQN
jgi:cytochrome c